MTRKTILLADDDRSICTVLSQAFTREGYDVLAVHDAAGLMALANAGRGDAVITDVAMPGGSGLELLPRLREKRPELPVIVISAQNTLLTAVQASQLGAYDYLSKPFDLDALVRCVGQSLGQQAQAAPDAQTLESGPVPIIGRSPAMQEIYRLVARMVGNDLTLLVSGESGTGKELVARALHALGPRANKPFIALNMAAIPRELVESELFGHEKGAFTGAFARKAGAFEQAQGGTLFLDEIGDMPPHAQTRLLRVLQEGEFSPVGGTRSLAATSRIVAATHRDLQALCAQGLFREDLYFRLNVVPVRMPPLRERTDDIPALAAHFLAKGAERGLPRKELAQDALPLLAGHAWPGNIRELENMIYRLASLSPERAISAQAVRQVLAETPAPPQADTGTLSEAVRRHVGAYFRSHGAGLPPPGIYDRLMALCEKPLIELTLEAVKGNQVKAARILGINRNTLRKKMDELGIAPRG